jgi:hypothetical protein
VALSAGAGVHVVPHRSLAIGLDVDLLVPLVRPGFAFDDVGEFHRAAAAGVAALVGLEGRFP